MAPTATLAAVALLFGLLLGAHANMYDVLERHKLFPLACESGCAQWSDVARDRTIHNLTHIRDTAALWADGAVPAGAANLCAMPGRANPTDYTVEDQTWVEHAYAGSFCYCSNASAPIESRYSAQYCRSARGVPEQINLQLASSTTIVVGFVTFESALPGDPPTAEFGKLAAAPVSLTGVSHWYMEKSGPKCNFPNTGPCVQDGRNYTMSFIKFANLEPGASYTYRVKSGASDGAWSDRFTFRAIQPDGGTTRIAVYGDMGVYSFNNMQNLQEDCASGTIDAIVHMGDHVYFWEDEDNLRGDAYMNAFQPTLSSCPWMPILGNHEYNDADDSWRVVNQTWGEAYGQPASSGRGTAAGQENRVGDVAQDEELSSTTDTAMGHFMTRHNLYAQGTHGAHPSGTSRWYSVNVGQMHLVGLDLGQNGQHVGPSNTTGESPYFWEDMQQEQIQWLRADLAAVDRKITPWVMVMSHYPFYHTVLEDNADMSAAWYVSPEAEEFVGELADKFKPCAGGNTCMTVGERVRAVQQVLDPIFSEFGVEFYNAGHVHDYTVNWPQVNGTVTQQNYSNLRGTVHICEGNGGVPQPSTYPCNATTCDIPCSPRAPFCRIHRRDPAYGRWTASNGSVITYEHVPNDPAHFANGTETWHVSALRHGGPFLPPPQPPPRLADTVIS